MTRILILLLVPSFAAQGFANDDPATWLDHPGVPLPQTHPRTMEPLSAEVYRVLSLSQGINSLKGAEKERRVAAFRAELGDLANQAFSHRQYSSKYSDPQTYHVVRQVIRATTKTDVSKQVMILEKALLDYGYLKNSTPRIKQYFQSYQSGGIPAIPARTYLSWFNRDMQQLRSNLRRNGATARDRANRRLNFATPPSENFVAARSRR